MSDITLYLTQQDAANLLKMLAAWQQPGMNVSWSPGIDESLRETMRKLTEKLRRRVYGY